MQRTSPLFRMPEEGSTGVPTGTFDRPVPICGAPALSSVTVRPAANDSQYTFEVAATRVPCQFVVMAQKIDLLAISKLTELKVVPP